MSEFGDFLMLAIAAFYFGFITLGAVGGWFLIAALWAREDELKREALKHAREDIVRANPIGVRDVRI